MATYITKQDFFDFSGIDLDIELRKNNTDNPSQAVEIFLKREEDWALNKVQHDYFGEFNATAFSEGMLYQIEYRLKNGRDGKLSPDAYDCFHRGGMCNITPTRCYRRC